VEGPVIEVRTVQFQGNVISPDNRPHPPAPFYEYRFVNTCESKFVKIFFAWTEDKALRGRNLSAAPRLEAIGGECREILSPFLFVRLL
jgi:hypothetical protein